MGALVFEFADGGIILMPSLIVGFIENYILNLYYFILWQQYQNRSSYVIM